MQPHHTLQKAKHVLKSILQFYIDGFKNMIVGKILWTIILIKLFIMFFIIKPVYFSRTTENRNDAGQAESDHVYKELVNRSR